MTVHIEIKAAEFDVGQVVDFVSSVAYAKAANLHTTQQTQSYSKNSLMNFILMGTTGQPGFPEVHQDRAAIENSRKSIATSLLRELIEKSSEGGKEYFSYLARLEDQKANALAGLQRTFTEAARTSSEIDNRLRNAINVLATVKVVSSVAIAVTPVGLAATGASATLIASAGMVSFAYSVTKGAAKNLAEGNDAGVIAFDAGKDGVKEAVSGKADKIATAAGGLIAEKKDLIAQAEGHIARLTKQLAGNLKQRKVTKLTRQLAGQRQTVETATRTVGQATVKKTAAKAVPVVFAAWDVWDACGEFVGDFQTR